jgi:hypothetical protein
MMEFLLLHAAIENFKETNAKSKEYIEQTNERGIEDYFSYDQFNYTEPRLSITRNYGYNQVDINKIKSEIGTQRMVDIISTIVVCIPIACLIVAFFYAKTKKMITIISVVFIIAFICSAITYFYLNYM